MSRWWVAVLATVLIDCRQDQGQKLVESLTIIQGPQRHRHDKSAACAQHLRRHTLLTALDAHDDDHAKPEETPVVTYFSPNAPLSSADGELGGDDEAYDGASARRNSTFAANNEYSFFDEATIYVRAGSGGQGASTFKKMGKTNQNGPPDGGNGGKGGNVVLVADPSLNTLASLSLHALRPNAFGGATRARSTRRHVSFRAENGAPGARHFKSGRTGNDVVIRVPPGTHVEEIVSDETDDDDPPVLVSLGRVVGSAKEDSETRDVAGSNNGHRLTVARGGEGGEGSGVVHGSRGVRRPRAAAVGGERKRLKLTLQIVADVALVGVPNAGKSTFLAAVTRAKPKIANYPFTTVIPNLGVWMAEDAAAGAAASDFSDAAPPPSLVLCDVPGLIAGAAQGVGLGHAFLRHVERCHVILHLVDATSIDPLADYHMLNREIVKYGTGQLAQMPQVVVVNKVDAYNDGESSSSAHSPPFEPRSLGEQDDWEQGLQVKMKREKLEQELKEAMPHSRLLWMSAREREGVDELMTRLAAFVQKVKDSKEAI